MPRSDRALLAEASQAGAARHLARTGQPTGGDLLPASYVETRPIPIDKLTRFPGNARRGDVDRIRESIRRHGQYRALVVRDTGDGLVILAGNHTRDALAAEGHTEARCEVITCDDDEARRINLADNRLAEIGAYDEDALAELLSYLDGDYDGTGYTAEDVDALVHMPEELPGGGDPDDTPEPPEPPEQPRSVTGDLWLLGDHRLLCGDTTNLGDLDRVLEGLDQPGIIYTDPPYGISIVRPDGKIGSGGKFRGKIGSGKVVPTTEYLPVAGDDSTDVARDAFTLLTSTYPDAVHVWWGGNHYAASAGLPDSSCWLVWDKENGDNGFADAELAWTSHPGAVRLFRHMWNGMLRATERGKRVHPTQKPVALAEWAFETIDPKKERLVVFDGFAGSGSTLIAADRTGRTAAVVEMEPAYVDVICRRYQEHTGTKPVHAETGQAVDFTAGPANQ